MLTNTKATKTSRRGFASMSPEERRRIASLGGKAAHAGGNAHRYTSEEARKYGSLGGKAAHRKGVAHTFTPAEAREAGMKGYLNRGKGTR